jgi:hypothetical protein
MDIAALSVNLTQMKVAQQVSVSVMKLAMDSAQSQSNDLVRLMAANAQIMEQSVNPHLGANLDVQA